MRPNAKLLKTLAWAAAALAAAAAPSEGSTFVTLDADELVVGSVAVVEGRVTAVRSSWNEPRTAIHTYSDVRIDRVIVGEAPPVVTVRTPGGEADGVRVEVEGFPELRRAQRVVLFLQLAEDGTARVTGHRQGQYTIVPGPRGEAMAISAHRPDPHVVGPTEPDPRLPAVLPLAELTARVRSLARSARPTPEPPVR